MGTPVQHGHSLGRHAAWQGTKALRSPAGRALWVGTFPFLLHPPLLPLWSPPSASRLQALPALLCLTGTPGFVPAQAISLDQICYLQFNLPVKRSADPTPPLHGPPPLTCLGAQQAFGMQISAACGPNAPGPQHPACQPSSQGGPPASLRGLESRSGEIETIWPGSPAQDQGGPPGRRPAGLTQAPWALPHAGAGTPRFQLCLPTQWSPLPSEPHFHELQNRSGPPTFGEKNGCGNARKGWSGAGLALPPPRAPPAATPAAPAAGSFHPSGAPPSLGRSPGFIPAAELHARQALCLGHFPLPLRKDKPIVLVLSGGQADSHLPSGLRSQVSPGKPSPAFGSAQGPLARHLKGLDPLGALSWGPFAFVCATCISQVGMLAAVTNTSQSSSNGIQPASVSHDPEANLASDDLLSDLHCPSSSICRPIIW